LHGPETVSIFVSHCCDVILLCIVSQISNKTQEQQVALH